MKQMRKAFSTGLTVAEIASTTRCIARRDQPRVPHDRQSSTCTLKDGADGGARGAWRLWSREKSSTILKMRKRRTTCPPAPASPPAAAALQRCSIAETQHRSGAATQHRSGAAPQAPRRAGGA
jgi:hypothetical protein